MQFIANGTTNVNFPIIMNVFVIASEAAMVQPLLIAKGFTFSLLKLVNCYKYYTVICNGPLVNKNYHYHYLKTLMISELCCSTQC